MRYLVLHIWLILIPAVSFAATDTLSVVEGTGFPVERAEALVALTNTGRVAGAQFDLVAEGGRLRWVTARCAGRAAGMEVHSRIAGDTLRVVLIDPGRRGGVDPGAGPILTVQADILAASGEAPIGLGRAQVADDGHPPQVRDAAAQGGRILVLSNRLSVEEGASGIFLLNADRVAAAQFDLVYDSGAVSVAGVRLTPRCAGMSAFTASVSPGRTRVVLADFQGGASIPPGEGPLAEVLFQSRRVSPSMGTVRVEVDGAVLSGPGGARVRSGVRGGMMRVMPKGRPRVVIDEVLTDPPDGSAGDANGDGVRDTFQDEFVEILNADTTAVDVSGWTLSDDDAPATGRFRFPPGTVLRPGERAVLFGGGHPAGIPGRVFTDDGRIGDGLSNAGDTILLLDAEAMDTVSVAILGGAEDQSLARYPEGSGEFLPHASWPGRGAFSPGRSRAVASGLRVAPEVVTLKRGEQAPLHAVATFTDGGEDTVRSGLTWSTDRPDVATVNGSGKVTGVKAGVARVTAGIGTFRPGAEVRVEDLPPVPPPVPAAVTPVVTSPDTALPKGTLSSGPVPVASPTPIPDRPPAMETVSLRPARSGVFYRMPVVAVDADGDRLTFSLVSGPGWLGMDAATGVLSGRPEGVGEIAVEIQVEDGRGEWARRTYRLAVLPRRRIVIDEALADPPSGTAGDANGDGVRDPYQDEFVEVLNADTMAVDVSGWTLSDDDAAGRFRFPQGTILRPGERAVLFGGGHPAGIPGRVFVDDGRIGDGLSNTGERVLMIDPQEGDTVEVAALPKAEGQSLARYPEGSGPFVPHGSWPGRGAFSPGRGRPLAAGLRIAPEAVTLRPGGTASLRVLARFTDGGEDTVRTGLVWSSDRPEVVVVDGNGKIKGVLTGATTIRVRAGEMAGQAEITVEPPPNHPPMIDTAGLRPARAGVSYREPVAASDADGDGLRFSLAAGPAWLWIDAGTGVLTGRPEGAGEVVVEIQAEDGRGERGRRSYGLTVLPRRRVVIDEVLADPPGGASGDVNGDGVRDTYQDEFVEILNADTAAVDVSGWTLSDDDAPATGRFRFPQGTVLHPGERAVLFGGGHPAGAPGQVFTDDGRIGDGLSNTGERVLMIDPQEGDTVDVVAFGKAEGQSLARYPEGTGGLVPHSAFPGHLPCSPGRGRPLLRGITATGEEGPLRPGERRKLMALAAYSDEGMEEVSEFVTWVGGDTSVARLEGRATLRAIRPGQTEFVARWDYVVSLPYRVTVLPFENRPPAMTALPDTAVVEDSPFRLRARASDPDGDEVRFSLVRGPAWLSIDPGSGLISGVPDDPDVGTSEVTAESSDGRLTASRTFRVTVRNRPPSLAGDPRRRGWVGFSYGDSLRVQNLDGGTLRLSGGPPGMDLEGMRLRWRPSAAGRWSVTVQALDPHGGEATMSWEAEALAVPLVVVDEILTDPPRGLAGDANGDGRVDGGEDEFIELLNAGSDTAALGGLRLGPEGTSGARLFRFPEGTRVPPGGRLLVFGGGTPGDFPCPVFVDGGRIGRGLSAEGGAVVLIDPAGPDTLLRAAFPGRSGGQSWTRRPSAPAHGPAISQGPDAFAPHGDLPGRGRFSPGRPRPVLTGLSVVADTTIVVGGRRPFEVMGIFGDGGQEAVTGQVVLVISDTTVLRMEGARLAGVGPGRSSVRARFEEIEGVAEVRVVSAKTAPISPGSRQVPGGLASSGASPVRDTVSVGAGYRLRAQALPGISLSWTVVEGPAWLVVDTETGDLVGSPPDEGTYEVVLAGEDSTGQAALVVVTLTARGKVEAGEVPGAGSSEPDPGAQGEGGGIVLSPNAPNPFNGTTVFRCRSPTPGRVEVYTLLGHCVRRWAEVGVGQTALVWDGRDGSGKALPSGVYFLVFEAGGVRMTRRMALIR